MKYRLVILTSSSNWSWACWNAKLLLAERLSWPRKYHRSYRFIVVLFLLGCSVIGRDVSEQLSVCFTEGYLALLDMPLIWHRLRVIGATIGTIPCSFLLQAIFAARDPEDDLFQRR